MRQKQDRESYIAHTIAQQLGGRLRQMVGAKNLIMLEESDRIRGGLRFDMPSNLSRPRISRVVVELNGGDLYDVKFLLRRKVPGKMEMRETVVSEHKDVFCGDLIPLFENATGLVLRMPRVVMA